MKNKKYLMYSIFFIFIIFSIYSASAACTVKGYSKDINGDYISSNINAYCNNLNSQKNMTKDAGRGWAFSWGGPADSCSSICGQVYINASSKSSIPEKPILLGYAQNYPMNSGNTPGFGNGGGYQIWANITLSEINEKASPIYKPISISQQKKNQEKSIKRLNSVITKEYRINKDNLNKVQSIMKYGEEPYVDSSSTINQSWWQIILSKIKMFLGIK